MTVEAFPLHWPEGRPRTPSYNRRNSPFRPGNRSVEAKNVIEELKRLGARDVIISTNVRLRQDGLPYSTDKAPTDQGVAVYFSYKGGQKCFACDRWATIPENLRAIWKSIEAMRGLERWGSKDFVDAAFTGFAALPAPGAHAKRPWRTVLGIAEGVTVSRQAVETFYKQAAKRAHPDLGGSMEAMAEVNAARDQAYAEIA